MKDSLDIFTRGVRFVRNNPQIIYTLFLVVAIPSAFFFTSEQFLKVARENQDRLERGRIALLQETFLEFLPAHLDGQYLHERILHVAQKNETLDNFQIILNSTSSPSETTIFSSLKKEEIGMVFIPDETTTVLLGFALANEKESFAFLYANQYGRAWKSIHAFSIFDPISGVSQKGYIVTDISMAQADAVAKQNIRNAYIVLGLIVLLIIILLARQARIIDYATLYTRLKEVDQMKDDFVSMAAHELRTPLTIIRGYVSELGYLNSATEEDKKKTYLSNIDNAATQLNSLIGDILDVARLQEGRMSFRYTNVDVSQDIETVVASLARPAQDKGLTLSYEKIALPQIAIDGDRFRQVLINLVGNAIKYTPSGGVKVLTSIERGRVVIRVSDTGMGISATDQEKLFQKFFRVKNVETDAISGTGLGLWITATMVKTMKGTIGVESIKGKGTDFIISFPVVG